MNNQDLSNRLTQTLNKREYQITNRDKMIKYLQEECKKRGEEIIKLKKEVKKWIK